MSKLIILGNGFDRNFNLPTDYTENLKPILEKKNKELFNKLDKLYFDEKIEYWSDFEGNIGKVKSIDFIHDQNRKRATYLFEIDFIPFDSSSEHYGDDYTAVDNAICEAERNSVDLIETFDTEHAEDLEYLYSYMEDGFVEMSQKANRHLHSKIKDITDDFEFSSGDYYITFNYTSTLEILNPDIPTTNILHIHGKADENEELIFGNMKTKIEGKVSDFYEMNPYYTPSDKGKKDISNFDDFIDAVNISEESFSEYNDRVTDAINTLNDQMIKPLQIEELDHFLKYKNISQIYVYGLSCGEVDIEYLEKINKLCSNPSWYVSFFRNKSIDPVCKNCMKLSFFHRINFKETSNFKDQFRKI